MKKKKKKECLKMLELGEKASRDDIENAYSHFVKLYSSEDSPEIHPLKEEISIEERKKILFDIDEAYKALVGEDGVNRIDFSAEIEPQVISLDEEDPEAIEYEEISPSEKTPDEDEPVVEIVFTDEPMLESAAEDQKDDINEINEPIVVIPEGENEEEVIADEIEPQVIEFEEDPSDEDEGMDASVEEEPEIIEQKEVVADKTFVDTDVEITGKYLKEIRESRKLKVRDVGEILNIGYKSIVNIENERFEKLNDPGFLRWLIKSYSKFLGINEEKSAEDYMIRYRRKK